eukprot:COSAG05_NODE_385_length_10486_cov_12.944835_10_plen_97_part_00
MGLPKSWGLSPELRRNALAAVSASAAGAESRHRQRAAAAALADRAAAVEAGWPRVLRRARHIEALALNRARDEPLLGFLDGAQGMLAAAAEVRRYT